jgi:hypothetical protein
VTANALFTSPPLVGAYSKISIEITDITRWIDGYKSVSCDRNQKGFTGHDEDYRSIASASRDYSNTSSDGKEAAGYLARPAADSRDRSIVVRPSGSAGRGNFQPHDLGHLAWHYVS